MIIKTGWLYTLLSIKYNEIKLCSGHPQSNFFAEEYHIEDNYSIDEWDVLVLFVY